MGINMISGGSVYYVAQLYSYIYYGQYSSSYVYNTVYV